MSHTKLVISCPDGFSYVGWNRVEFHLDNGTCCGMPRRVNVGNAVSALMVSYGVTEEIRDVTGIKPAGECVFVQGAESSTLHTIGEFVRQIIRLPIELVDGHETLIPE